MIKNELRLGNEALELDRDGPGRLSIDDVRHRTEGLQNVQESIGDAIMP